MRNQMREGQVTASLQLKLIRWKLVLRYRQKRKLKATTNSKHTLPPIAPNLLARDFRAFAPSRAWVSGITYIPTAKGWLYLAGIKSRNKFRFYVNLSG
mgnify:CR=1 FL=1